MSGHAVVHRNPGVSLKTHVFHAHMASVRRWRIVEKREAMSMLFEGRRRPWVTEEAARRGKRRSLIDDNPAAG